MGINSCSYCDTPANGRCRSTNDSRCLMRAMSCCSRAVRGGPAAAAGSDVDVGDAFPMPASSNL